MTRRPLDLATATVCSLLLAASCTKDNKAQNADDALPARPVNEQPIAAQRAVDTLDIKVDLRDDGMLLHVGAVPGGATLECHLDNLVLTPCHDGALLVRPAAGDHKITAKALRDGNVMAQGVSAVFTVSPGAGAVDAEPVTGAGSLALAADAAFVNGATVPLTKDFTARFKLAGKAPCDKPVMKCKYDSRTSKFWTACDAGDQSFSVRKDLLAMGLQYLSVQASCGDQVGPTLTMFWWGVPDGYQPLALNDLKDSNGRHFLNLVKADDCPVEKQKFECAPTAQDDFSRCTNGNSLDQPAAGYRVRLSCDGKAGPVLAIAP